MNKKYIVIGLIALLLLVLPILAQAETYGDKTCTWTYSLWFCRNTDYSLDKYFWNYQDMNNWYTPEKIETFIPEKTYLYVTGGTTETFSGT